MRMVAALVLLALPLVSPASAAPEHREGSDRLNGVLDCKNEVDDARRLACYDRAVGALATSVKSADVVVVDKAEMQAARRSLFGFSIPRLPVFGGDKSDDVKQVVDTVASARPGTDGNWIVTTRSGSTWMQTDGQTVARAPRPGDDVIIVRGTLGSYFMRVGKQAGVKVRRQG